MPRPIHTLAAAILAPTLATVSTQPSAAWYAITVPACTACVHGAPRGSTCSSCRNFSVCRFEMDRHAPYAARRTQPML